MVELETGEFLYNLDADPGEKQNLAEQHPEIVARFKNIHQEWRASLEER